MARSAVRRTTMAQIGTLACGGDRVFNGAIRCGVPPQATYRTFRFLGIMLSEISAQTAERLGPRLLALHIRSRSAN